MRTIREIHEEIERLSEERVELWHQLSTEYDPQTGESLSEFVDVGDAGVVTTWAWTTDPRPGQPLDRPFAWALIRLDGADTAMLHAVDAGDESKMATGMRVKVRWAAEPVPDMAAIACFEVEAT